MHQGVSVQGDIYPGVGLCLGGSVQGSLCPGRSLSGGLCPGGGVLCPGVGVFARGVSAQGQGGSLPGGGRSQPRGVSVRETPPTYGKERAVRILLECILVFIVSTSRILNSTFLYLPSPNLSK